MSERGFQQWAVRRTDLGARDAGVYSQPKSKANPNPPPKQANTVVYAESLAEALAQGAALLGCSQAVLTATKIFSGFGVGESG